MACCTSTSGCRADGRRCSLPSDALFGPSLSTDVMLATVSDRAWVQAMLDVEAALARAEARIGLIPSRAAEGIAAQCRVDEFDVEQRGRAAVRSGTLSAFKDRGLDVARELAAELTLSQPALPWHTARGRVVEVATALAIAAGAAGKVALDVVLLAQTEVGEVSESTVAGRGASSALPQKHNPVDAIEILAAVRGINAQVTVLLGAMLQEHERAAGAWQAEWPAFAETLRLAGGAVSRLA